VRPICEAVAASDLSSLFPEVKEKFYNTLAEFLSQHATKGVHILLAHRALMKSVMDSRFSQPLHNEIRNLTNVWLSAVLDNLHDVTIVVTCDGADQQIPCHRYVLSSRSSYFKAMFTNGMSESNQSTVRVPFSDMKALRCLLDWMYTDRLNCADFVPRTNAPMKPLLLETQKYMCEKKCCQQNLADEFVEFVMSVFCLAHVLGSDGACRQSEAILCEAVKLPHLKAIVSFLCDQYLGDCTRVLEKCCRTFILSHLGFFVDDSDVLDFAWNKEKQ